MGPSNVANGHASLPPKDSSDIRLVEATMEEDEGQQRANSSEWRGPLTVEAYLRREKHLANQDQTRYGGLTSWVLVYQPAGEIHRKVLCGCETHNKKALFGSNGKVEDVVAHGVCSVFCPEEHRGRGYAGRMMTEVGKVMRRWQMKDAQQALFSVLFSDIGKDFYAARGWHPFPSAHLSLPPTSSVADGLPSTRSLRSDDIPELCDVDEKLIRARLSSTKGNDKPTVALIPERRTLDWHYAREQFVSNELYAKSPEIKGALVGEPGSRVWCYWTRIWANPTEESPNTLHILRLVIEKETPETDAATAKGATKPKHSSTVQNIAALFAAAQSEAAQWDMKEVQIWNPTSTTLAAAQLLEPKTAVVQREHDSITSLQWYGEGCWKDVDWICNEKYGWC